MRLRGSVVEENRRFSAQLGRVEGVSHDQEDIDVVGLDPAGNERPEDHTVPYDLALVYACLGDEREAYNWLRKAVEIGWRDYRLAQIDPLLEHLRRDPKFEQLMAEVKNRVERMREQVHKMEEE